MHPLFPLLTDIIYLYKTPHLSHAQQKDMYMWAHIMAYMCALGMIIIINQFQLYIFTVKIPSNDDFLKIFYAGITQDLYQNTFRIFGFSMNALK